MSEALKHKKDMILDAARDLGVQKWTVAEIDQLRRKLLADHGEAGKTGNDYIADVLKAAGWKIQITEREEAEERLEKSGCLAFLPKSTICRSPTGLPWLILSQDKL